MQRICQTVFVASVLALSWLGMMAVHELGHVLGAGITGGTVQRCVLHPLTISRTDVQPNPHPVVVVWLGPILGSALPLVIAATIPARGTSVRYMAQFFAGFCLIANGAYLAVGCIDQVGDCREMLQHNVSILWLLAFGAVTIPAGLYLWHRMGSPAHFLQTPSLVTRRMMLSTAMVLMVAVVVECVWSPR